MAFMAFSALASEAYAQGRRLGFVVGLADYGETPHPTALQDAGLVAQSLKAAGFELTEAANLSQTEFRAAFRDFVEKAGNAGPDAVLAVYVSGVGFQDDGENILIPTGARLRSRTDLSLEGLRASDFIRSISGVPAAARIVMLDAAYTHPYGQLVADGGRGFAPVERREGLLVAFNQSPDQAATLPRTAYGQYAMALAEILREPGLDLNQVFERVRLRVHDLSQGAETPWNVNGITTPIVLNAPGAGAPAVAAAPQAAEIRRRPIRELGGDEAYARAVEIDTIQAYEEFLRAHPSHAQARRVRAMVAARREAYYWQRARRANTDRSYWTYLRRYPRGAHAAEAESRLTRLSAPIAPPPQFEEIIYDDLPPPPAEEIEVYETVIVDDRWDSLPPPQGYAVHLLPPPPVEIIELAPPPPNPVSRVLPAVAIGAGLVGGAILLNRAWKRPEPVRPVVAPPIPRPPRPGYPPGPGVVRPGTGGPMLPPAVQPVPGQPGVNPPVGGRPPVVGQPVPPPGSPVVNPPGTNPPPGTSVPPTGVRPPGTPTPPPGSPVVNPPTPGVTPPAGTPGAPVVNPPTGVRPPGTPTPPPGAPVVNPPTPGVTPPAQPGIGAPPGAIRPPGPATPPPGGAVPPRPGAIQPAPTPPPAVAPTPPPATPPVTPPPQLRGPAPNQPGIAPRPPSPPNPPGAGVGTRPPPQVQAPPRPVAPPPPQVRQTPPPQVRQAPPPQVRQAPPPQFRPVTPPPQQPRYMPVPQRQAPPPQVQAPPRPVAPPPQVRQAPPPAPRPVAPPPAPRPVAPPPAAAPPRAAPAPIGCTPPMRAARQC